MNRQLLLIKTKTVLSLFVLFLSLCACDSLKQVQSTTDNKTSQSGNGELDAIEGKRVYNPDTGQYEVVKDVTGELEEVVWEEEENTAPPISSEATDLLESGETLPSTGDDNYEEDAELLPTYNMVLALPFLANQVSSYDTKIDNKSLIALNFYEGAKMAFDVLSNEEINLDVHILDTRATETETRSLTYRYELSQAHLIIGTFKNSNTKVVADFAQQSKIPFVSPYYPHNFLVDTNRYFIQLNPSIKTHCEAVMQHVKSQYSPEQIILVGRDTRREQGIINLYQKAHYQLAGTSTVPPLKVVSINDQTASLENTEIKEHFLEDKKTVFVVASSNEGFVYSLLRKIDIAKKNVDEENEENLLEDNELVVYGQPRWKDFTKISYDYYEKLNLHVSSESFFDPNSYEVSSFKQNFFNKYGTVPTEQAFKGYDTVLYFGRMLKEYGPSFYNKLDQNYKDMLHTRFAINRVVTKPRTTGMENLNLFDQYENTHVNILEFKDYQFQKVN